MTPLDYTEGKYDDAYPALREGEPFFFLRGQDVLAPFAVQVYAGLLRAAAAGAAAWADAYKSQHPASLRDQAEHADRIAAQMLAWQAGHGHKLPD